MSSRICGHRTRRCKRPAKLVQEVVAVALEQLSTPEQALRREGLTRRGCPRGPGSPPTR